MNSDTSRQVQDCSSSGLMAVSVPCKATIELGKKLVEELESERTDTLGRWMAHYIAELIQEVEKATVGERSAKMAVCYGVILNLWKHRYNMPDGQRPFEDLEKLLEILKTLDPEDDTPRYFSSTRDIVDNAEVEDETRIWLKLIEDLDTSAKILIRYCLTRAAQSTLDKSLEWVKLAEKVGDESEDHIILRFLSAEAKLLDKSDPDENERKIINDRINRLEKFSKMALKVAKELKQGNKADKIKSPKKKKES